MDDNLIYTITNSAVAGSFKQDMGELTAANITVSNGGKFAIPSESGGVGINITATRFPFAYSASNIIETVANNGTRTEVPNSDFAVYFLFSFQDPRNGEAVRALSAVTSYGTITEARAVTWQTILATVSGLSGGEVRPLYRLIYESRSAYGVEVKKAVLREYADIRQSAILTASSASGSLPATSITVTPAGNISSTNAQSALEELDSEKLSLAGGTITGNISLGENTSLVLNTSVSADGKYNGITVSGVAGSALAFGDIVHFQASDSRWELADANVITAAQGDCRGLLGVCVLAAAGDGSATIILLQGIVRADTAFSSLTINGQVYLSETAGDITQTQPTTTDAAIRVLGQAYTADSMYFNPSPDYIIHT